MSTASQFFGGSSAKLRKVFDPANKPAVSISHPTNTFIPINYDTSFTAVFSTPSASYGSHPRGLIHFNGLWIHGRQTAASNTGQSSPDLITWTNRTLPSSDATRLSAKSPTALVMINSTTTAGGGYYSRSTDGITFSGGAALDASNPSGVRALRYTNGNFFACLNYGAGITVSNRLYRSTDDGVSFSAVTLPSAVDVYDINWNGSAYLLYTSGGIYSSVNFSSWTLKKSIVDLGMSAGSTGTKIMPGGLYKLGTRYIATVTIPGNYSYNYGAALQSWISDDNGETWQFGGIIGSRLSGPLQEDTAISDKLYRVSVFGGGQSNEMTNNDCVIFKNALFIPIYRERQNVTSSGYIYLTSALFAVTYDGIHFNLYNSPFSTTPITTNTPGTCLEFAVSTDGNTLIAMQGQYMSIYNPNCEELVINV